MMKRFLCLLLCLTALLASAAVTEHPRLWLTNADLPRLRSWATASNPLFENGLKPLAARAKADMDAGLVPANDCGSTNWEAYPTEMYAELFAFMSLVDNDSAARADYASRARSLLMYVINIAALGPATVGDYVCQGSSGYPPFRSPLFFTEDSNRARYHGEAFPLVVDWIYPSLTATDKQAIRGVFLRWSQEIIDRGYHHPEPVGLVNAPALLSDRGQVRWAGNNYFTAHMRNLGLMALALDAPDDANSQLRNYLGNATGAWLYLFDHLTRTDSQGGFLPEGFEYSPQTASYAIQFLLALRTAGADTCGSHCQLQGNPFWDDFLSAYYHSLSPATIINGDGLVAYQPAWYGDAQTYASTDSISALGALGVYDTVVGNQARLQSLRWAQTHTPPGGASQLEHRVSSNDEFRNSLLYFLLYDPGAATPSDPRRAIALEYFAPGLNRILARTSWDSQASWFNYSLSWSLIDHQHANGNQFEWYRKGEWLTKQRTGYADIAEGIASSEFSNALAVENDRPDRDDSDWRIDLWQRGAQWNLVAAGDPQLVAHSSSTAFSYATGDATNLYNSSYENVTDVLHASRSILWLKPDAVVVYDRARSKTANRFKRWWLQSATPAIVNTGKANITTAGGQQLQINSLLPSGATLSAVNINEPHIEATVAGNEPMKVRLRIDAPGNPAEVRFLQVLQAADAGAIIGAPTLIQSADAAWQGAQMGSTVVLFASTLGQALTNLSYTFTVPVASHIITGLAANTAYCVTLGASSLSLSPGCSQLSDSGGVFQYSPLNVPAKSNQTISAITFSPNTLTVAGSATASATATSGLPVAFASSTAQVCSVSGSIVNGLATGTCRVTADQAGSGTYAAAPQVAQDITVLFAAGETLARPLKVVGRSLQDTHGNNLLLRGVNLPVYKSGWADDLDAVAAAIALTRSNAVRLEWWAVPPAGTSQYTLANLDRAIQKYYDLGLIPVVELHDLTFQYGHDAKTGALSDGNSRTLFANTITAFWTRADVLAVLVKHQNHLVINLANEWGSSLYGDGTSASANFIQNYSDAITAMRNAGIAAPLMVDAPKGFEYQFLLDHGAALLALDPQHNMLLSTHAYWAASDPAFSEAGVSAILDAFMNSGLPVVLGEASSNAYTNIPCDAVHYAKLLTRANSNAIGYLFWAWYEDGQCGQLMNITVAGDGVTRPAAANTGFGYDALYAAGYGIDAAQPPTLKADFSLVNAPALVNTSLGYNITSSNDGVTRAAMAQVTRLNNFGLERRPVVVLMPGWGGTGGVPAAQNDPQAILFANQGYVALNIGFHQTGSAPGGALADWYSDLSESTQAALDALCLQNYADCSAVVLTGESFGGTQIHPVVRYLRANSVFDGSGGANAGRNVVGLLGQDSGYTQYWSAPVDADASAYSIAMIQNLGDTTFPVDTCDWGNCGARNRADYHQSAVGSQYVLSHCPAGGEHGTRAYADWDAWVVSAVKTMLHNQRGVARFTGYVEPPLAPGNDCVSRAPGTYALTVTPSGSGAVTSNPAGIDCGATCRASFDAGTSVTLSANPAPGSSFTGWGGACSGVGSCVLSMTVAKSVTAGFQAFSLIDHYYSNILKRAPDAGGKAFWQNEVSRMSGLGVSPTETHIAMAGSFYISPEFLARGLTDDQFIQSLYLTFLSRSADQSGLDYWRGLFAAGVPRDMVMYGFVFSAEFKSFMVQNLGSTSQRPEVGAVIDYYRGILGRLPENDGIKYWVNQFRTAQCSGNPTADVYAAATSIAAQFFGSPEYTGGSPAPRDYVADLYNAFMRRIAEPGGYNYWVNAITSEAQTRDQARQAFIDSPEFAARVQAITAANCVGMMQ